MQQANQQQIAQPQSQQRTIFIAGCGDVGSTLAQLLLQKGHRVIGLRRNINQLPQGIQGISADLTQIDVLKPALQSIAQCDILVYSAAASNHTEQGYTEAYINGLQNVLNALPCQPKHIFFTSSTGVYHQADHSWVDENSECLPTRFSGQIMLKAEQIVQQGIIPGTVVRFSGIYGPGRNHLINKVKNGEVATETPKQYTNRIHRDDCAGVLAHLIKKALKTEKLHGLYLATDDTPIPVHELTHWLAEQMHISIKTEADFGRTSSKCCSNKRLKESGYKLIYPNFKEGFREIILNK